jgi:hypothetical protein
MSVNWVNRWKFLWVIRLVFAVVALPTMNAFAGAETSRDETLQCDAKYACLKVVIDKHYSTFEEMLFQYKKSHLYMCYIFLFQWSYLLCVCAYVINSPKQEWTDIRHRLAFHLQCGGFFSLCIMAMLVYKQLQEFT